MFNPKQIIKALFFNRDAILEIKEDKEALFPGLILILLFVIAGAFLSQKNHSITNLLVVSCFYLFYWLVLVSVAGFIPLMLGGKASYEGYLRVLNYSAIPLIIALVPVIGVFGKAWAVLYLIYSSKEVFALTWNTVIKGTLMLSVICFFIFTAAVPYMVRPYGSIWLSKIILVSRPEKEGLSDFQAWDITVSNRVPETVYSRADSLGQKQCINDLIRDYSLNELQKHTFLLTSQIREITFKNLAITKNQKACCVYAEDLGKTISPGSGTPGKGFIQIDAICESRGMQEGGAYDLEVSVIYETNENGKTISHTDLGHIRGPNPIN